MALLYLSDILKKVGLEPSSVYLLRHSFSLQDFRECYEKGMVLDYTRQQDKDFGRGYDYWCVFISERGTLARLFGCYKVCGSVPDTLDVMPDGFPNPEHFQGNRAFFDLEHIDLLEEYENRLVIDWGNSTRQWKQKGSNEKPVSYILPNEKQEFPGYESLVLSYGKLKSVIDDPVAYETWRAALSSIYAVYLIVDRESGMQYVGSAYGTDGLWGRWSQYVHTQHGGNKELIKLLDEYPTRYHQFQFSILQVLPKSASEKEVLDAEKLYKRKLLTKEYGLNDN